MISYCKFKCKKHRRMKTLGRVACAFLIVIGGTSAAAWGAQPVSCPAQTDVRNVMTVTQFENTGLAHLSKKQLKAFNRWLSAYVHSLCSQWSAAHFGAAASENPHGNHARAEERSNRLSHSPKTSTGNTIVSSSASTPTLIKSRIVGSFDGWTGNTQFRLANGEVWRQAGPGYFRTHMNSPKVVIKKLLFGYVMLVRGYGKEVFVRRVK